MIIDESRALIEEHMLAQAGSVGELMEQFRGRISPALIDGAGWDKLLERARGLPVSLATSGFGFELPLHDSEPKADFGVPLIEGSRSAAHYEEWCRSQPASVSTTALVPLLREMGRDGSALRRIAGKKLLLEFDVEPARRGAPPEPGIFLDPDDDVLPGDGSAERFRDLGVVADAVLAVGGCVPDAAERRQLEHVFMAMSPDTHIGAVGTFPSRTRVLRLAVMGFRKTCALKAFLERAGWPGRPAALAPFVSDLEERGAFAHLGVHLDVQAAGVGPALGVSVYARDTQWLKDIEPWIPLIDSLRRKGLAVPEKLSALANSWSGAEVVFGRRSTFLIVRGIHHVKLVQAGDRIEQVKAYVFFLVFAPSLAAASTG